MATTPERSSIIDNIKSTLEDIIEGVVCNQDGDEYNYTPASVTKEPLPFDAVEFFPTYVIIDGSEDFEYYGARVVNWFTVLIRCIHNSERGMGDYSTKLNNMVRDVRRALAIDVTRGDYATNTEVIHVETDEGWLAPLITAEITVRVQYLSLEEKR